MAREIKAQPTAEKLSDGSEAWNLHLVDGPRVIVLHCMNKEECIELADLIEAFTVDVEVEIWGP